MSNKQNIVTLMGETIDSLKNTKGLLIGNIFTRDEVAEILNHLSNNLLSVVEDTPDKVNVEIDDDMLQKISDIAEGYARMYAQYCAENYEASESVSFDTYESHGELRVTANVELDSHDLSDCGKFASDAFIDEVQELLKSGKDESSN
jgi:hypothetical protein